jgi:hypothetical protein
LFNTYSQRLNLEFFSQQGDHLFPFYGLQVEDALSLGAKGVYGDMVYGNEFDLDRGHWSFLSANSEERGEIVYQTGKNGFVFPFWNTYLPLV